MNLVTETVGEPTTEERAAGRSIITGAPEWITVLEAAFAARVPKERVLDWLMAGRIEHVPLLGGQRPEGFLLRTADVRAAIEGVKPAGTRVVDDPRGRLREKEASSVASGVNRRRFIVVLGAAATAGLIPVRALAGNHLSGAPRRSEGGRVAENTLDLTCEIKSPEADTALVASADATRTDKPGGGGGGGSGVLSIDSVVVGPDPVAPGGSATITIDASPRRKNLRYLLSASEGVLTQDPRRPWIWTWSDA